MEMGGCIGSAAGQGWHGGVRIKDKGGTNWGKGNPQVNPCMEPPPS